MRLVIEREGGFTVVDDADAITEIDVRNDAVVLTLQGDVNKWTVDLPVSSHAEACRVSAAIAVKCGVLVEPLAEGPEVDGEDDVGEAMAVATRPSTTVRRVTPVSEWTRGEPPRDGMTYVAREGVNSLCVRWDGERWRMGMLVVELGAGVAHLPMPIPPR